MTDLADLDVGTLLVLLRARQAGALEVARAFLRRIDLVDRGLRAFARVNPRVEEEARALDAHPEAMRALPLAGIPVAVKDNIVTAGLETTCASRLLEGFVPIRDATAVARLRSAGAVVLGKTNLDEFGMGSSTENSSARPTRNPWDPDRVPGGSSGGSAAAVAARLAPAALGSDTGGSVRQPAAFCGVVGLKPTYGRVSRSGLVAFASSLDQIGPMARTVADCARLLEVLAGPDPDDATCTTAPGGGYLEGLDRGLCARRIGVPAEYLGAEVAPEVSASVGRAARALESAGARIEEVTLPHTPFAVATYAIAAFAEASSNLARYDGVRYGVRRGGDGGLRRMYVKTRGEGLGAEVKRRILLGTFTLSAGYYDAYYGKALRVRALIREDFLRLFRDGVDAVLTPTAPTPAFRLGEKTGDPLAMYLSDVHTAPASLAGLPAISVPAGLSSHGLPLGVQLVGPDFGEAAILGAAAAIESAVGPLPAPPAASGASA